MARRALRRFTVGRVSVVGFPGGGATMGGFGSCPGGGTGPNRSYDYDVDAEEVRDDDPGEPGLPRG